MIRLILRTTPWYGYVIVLVAAVLSFSAGAIIPAALFQRAAESDRRNAALCEAVNEGRALQREVLLARQRIEPPLPDAFYEATLPLTEPLDCEEAP